MKSVFKLSIFISALSVAFCSLANNKDELNAELLVAMGRALDPSQFNKVQDFIQQGANPNIQNIYGNTPLHLASYHLGNFEFVQYLISVVTNPNIQNRYGEIPFHIFLRYVDTTKDDSKNMAELFLANKADPNIPDNNGDTPFHEFLRRVDMNENSKDIMEFLLENKANPNIKNKKRGYSVS